MLIGNGIANSLIGFAGNDRLHGGGGNDELLAGTGVNTVFGDAGNNIINTRNGQRDTINCGANTDTIDRDDVERCLTTCERRGLVFGTLRLTPKAVKAHTDRPARVRLSWRHPRTWRKVRNVELRLTRDGVPVGKVTLRPRGERISANGAVKLVRKASRLSHKGTTVTARLAIRLDESLAGHTLTADVQATDTCGRRQSERNAGTIRVAE